MKEVPADKKKSLGKLPAPVRNKMGFMKNGGKVGYEVGGDVSTKDKKDPGFTKEFTSRVKKGMSPKERKSAEKRDAYELGLRNKKKGGLRGAATQIIDNAVGVGRGTASERKELKRGYEDMKKALKNKPTPAGKFGKAGKAGNAGMGRGVIKKKAGGKVKSYRHGGKCKIDGIAIRGKTRAKQRRS
jgi:hypothetical protein